MKKLIPFVLLTLALASCSQEKKLSRKAANAVEQSDYDKAIMYYDKILEKNPNSFYANAGKGIVLSEYVGNHEAAIPYLETALAKNNKDAKYKLNSNLGQSYQFVGNYPRALYYYGTIEPMNNASYADYDAFLSKRIADCKYALEHPEMLPPEKAKVANVGNTINTPMPEYGPVYVNGELIFTTKRKDDPGEQKNGLDGRYFEAIYVAKQNPDGSFATPTRYRPREPKLQLRNYGESVVSASPDGKKIYIYKGGDIYESDINDTTHLPKKLSKTINFSSLQNNACLSPDGKTLFFTAESEKEGRGGSDIYKSIRNDDGTWSKPQLMDYTINTALDEEAPYIDNNGTLFFASNGLPGYGGFDIYKTHMEKGQWTTPENLGQPVNSPGDDIYFILKNGSFDGYYSSARPGGYGDMDIYKVKYVSEEGPQCMPGDSSLILTAIPDSLNQSNYRFALQMPPQYEKNIRSSYWTVNGVASAETSRELQYNFNDPNGPNTYTVTAKVIAYCDTCPAIISMCTQTVITMQPMIVLNNDSLNTANNRTSGNNAMANNKRNRKEKMNGANGMNNNSNNSNNLNNGRKMKDGYLTDDQLKALSWNTNYEYFDYDKYQIREDAKAVLDQNISVLKNNANLRVEINGYADSRGSDAYNKNLSSKRANAVKDYLMDNGISKNRIKAIHAYGETNLVNDCGDGSNCTEDQHQLNRRVRFDVYGHINTPSTITLND